MIHERTPDLPNLAAEPKQPQVCKHFGCGKLLKPHEYLRGDKCSLHSVVKKPDLTKFVSH